MEMSLAEDRALGRDYEDCGPLHSLDSTLLKRADYWQPIV